MLKITLFLLTLVFCFISFANTSYSKEIPKTISKKTKKKVTTTSNTKAVPKKSSDEKLDEIRKDIAKLVNRKRVLNFTKVWAYSFSKQMFRGLSVSGTDTEGFWRFGITFLKANSQIVSNLSQVIPNPDDLSTVWIEVDSTTKKINTIIRPYLSLPFLKRKLWKNGSLLEVRGGIAYETNLYAGYQKYEISAFNLETKTLIVPNDFWNENHVTAILSANTSFWITYAEINASINWEHIMVAGAVGVKW